MKKIVSILVAVVLTAIIWAQSPQKMSYQAVIRNGSTLVVNQAVGIKISILQGSVSGTVIYTETQTPTTNGNGLVSLEIGSGEGFGTVNWANGPYFIKTETDPTGGITYTVTNTNQLLSIPYALYATNAESALSATTAAACTGNAATATTATTAAACTGNAATATTAAACTGNAATATTATSAAACTGNAATATKASTVGNHFLGEEYLGGIIFFLYINNTPTTNTEHGLIVSKTEGNAVLTSGTGTLVNANSTSDGSINTPLYPAGTSAVRTWITSLNTTLGTAANTWYLPSMDEVKILFGNRFFINNSTASGLTKLMYNGGNKYWSSTENSNSQSFIIQVETQDCESNNKSDAKPFRAIRKF
ncbi:MAG: hypothetical protein WCL70_08700 [Paludibacter sp.]